MKKFLTFLRQHRQFLVLFLFPVAWISTYCAAKFVKFTEQVYSQRIYYALREIFGRLTGWIPFSLAELILICGSIMLFIYIIRGALKIVKSNGRRAKQVFFLIANLICVSVAIYVWFVFVCGINYHRETFAEYAGLYSHPASVEELSALSEELILQMNFTREKLPEGQDGICKSTFVSLNEMAEFAASSYNNISSEYSLLGGYTPKPKLVLLSRVMSVANITGVYFPYTFECNVNADIPNFEIPATMMHEISHFKGFMREQEANFISYIACINSGDDFFCYSGLRLAAVHATNALYSVNRDEYQRIMQLTTDGVRRDMRANSEYWQQFETPVAEVATAMNNTYLRANSQESGVRSYGEMVDLLLADYRKKTLD